MTESTLTEWALSALVTYGPFALGLLLLVCAAGVPFPGSVILLAAGAFVRQGVISWPTALAFAVVGVVAGDSIAYFVGRLGGPVVERRTGNNAVWQQAHDSFNRYGGWAIFLSRWLLTPIGVPMSILSGLGGYVFWRFLLLDFAGEFLWVAGYGAVGYVVGSQFEYVAQILSDFSGVLVGLLVLAAGGWLAWRVWRRRGDAATLAAPQCAVQGGDAAVGEAGAIPVS